MSESTKLKNLLNKVKPSIQFEVRKKKPKTTVEFLEYAKEVEELLQLSSTNVDTHTSYDSKPTNMVRTTNTSSNLSSYYSNNSNNNYSSTPYRNSRINTPSYTSASHKSDVATTSRAQPSNSNYQFQSKKYTSLSQNHTHNINSQKQKNIQQYTNTSKKDSKTKSRSVNAIVSPALSSDCSNTHSYLSSIVCQICNQLGHDASSCPIDTGATKTFVNNQILHHIVSKKAILKRTYSFLLVDGVAPFQVLGLVNLSVQFNNFHSTITAHVAQHLCADMILGMDYINKYNMSISVKKQIVSLELNQQRTIVPIVNVTKPTKIPVVISNTVFLSPRATKEIVVSIPISSISLPFTLLSSFKSHICVTNDTKTLHFQNYRCTIKLRNLRKDSKFIRKGTHIGDLLYTSTFQQPRIFCSSCYKSNGTTKNLGMTSAFSNLNTIRNFSSREKISTSSKLCDPSAVNYLHLLVKDIENKQQKQHLLSLLLNFYDIFDITKHNIAQTPKSHVINTIPHPPPSKRICNQQRQANRRERLSTLFDNTNISSEDSSMMLLENSTIGECEKNMIHDALNFLSDTSIEGICFVLLLYFALVVEFQFPDILLHNHENSNSNDIDDNIYNNICSIDAKYTLINNEIAHYIHEDDEDFEFETHDIAFSSLLQSIHNKKELHVEIAKYICNSNLDKLKTHKFIHLLNHIHDLKISPPSSSDALWKELNIQFNYSIIKYCSSCMAELKYCSCNNINKLIISELILLPIDDEIKRIIKNNYYIIDKYKFNQHNHIDDIVQ
ncbi:unnamed protein product, partial [Rotaria magnacalcarata]